MNYSGNTSEVQKAGIFHFPSGKCLEICSYEAAGKTLRHAAMRQLKEGSSRLGDTINQDKRIWNILFLPPTSIPFSATLASVLALTVCSCESVQLTNVEKNKLREKNTII